jgi:hypothetical protein
MVFNPKGIGLSEFGCMQKSGTRRFKRRSFTLQRALPKKLKNFSIFISSHHSETRILYKL